MRLIDTFAASCGTGRRLADSCGDKQRNGRNMPHKPKLSWFVRQAPRGTARSENAPVKINVFD
jgi:hypothetical protein